MRAEDLKNREEMNEFRDVSENYTTRIINMQSVLENAEKELTTTDYFSTVNIIRPTITTCTQEIDLKIDEVFEGFGALKKALDEIDEDSITGLSYEAKEQLNRVKRSVVIMACFTLLAVKLSDMQQKQTDKLMRRIKRIGMKQAIVDDIKVQAPQLSDKFTELIEMLSLKPKDMVEKSIKQKAKRGDYE